MGVTCPAVPPPVRSIRFNDSTSVKNSQSCLNALIFMLYDVYYDRFQPVCQFILGEIKRKKMRENKFRKWIRTEIETEAEALEKKEGKSKLDDN